MNILNLGRLNEELQDTYLIMGVGMTSNIYLIRDEIIVDTGNGEPTNRIAPALKKIRVDPKDIRRIVLTHSHFDHIGGVEELTLTANPKVLAHPFEHLEIEAQTSTTPAALNDGDTIVEGDYSFQVLHTPGHTSGSICMYSREASTLISGDTVFSYGGLGRTDLPTGSTSALLESIRRISKLPVKHLLPGHGDPIVMDASQHILFSLNNIESLRFY